MLHVLAIVGVYALVRWIVRDVGCLAFVVAILIVSALLI